MLNYVKLWLNGGGIVRSGKSKTEFMVFDVPDGARRFDATFDCPDADAKRSDARPDGTDANAARSNDELLCTFICALAVEAAKTHPTTQPRRTNFLQFIAL